MSFIDPGGFLGSFQHVQSEENVPPPTKSQVTQMANALFGTTLPPGSAEESVISPAFPLSLVYERKLDADADYFRDSKG